MVQIRKSEERGHANHGWLDSYHTFSFADYYAPDFMGFRVLRVINDDRIDGGQGFPTHGHRDMEIISYIVDGALEHKDTLGNQAVMKPGEVQRMSAGTGIRHSEYNHLPDGQTRLLQIWILPDKADIKPGYEQKDFSERLAKGELVLAASRTGRQGSVSLSQDVDLYVAKTKKPGNWHLDLGPGRYGWVQVANGTLEVNGKLLKEGDGAAIVEESGLQLQSAKGAEFLVFDLP